MYRIEVATGDETVFRTIEELATGIRNGLITPRSRIYHGASQKWLPIEFHPHYKKALHLVTGGAPMIDTGPARPAPSSRRSPVPEARPPVAAPVPIPPPTPPSAEPITPMRPEIELPKISYPEVTPSAAEPLPVARRRQGGPGKIVAGAIVAIALAGGYIATTFASPRSEEVVTPSAAPAAAAEPEAGSPETRGDPTPAAPPGPTPQPVMKPAPAAQAPVQQPAVSAPPRIGAAPRPAGPVSQAWSSSAGAIAPLPTTSPAATTAKTVAPAQPAPALTPAPATLELAVPELPASDSLFAGPAGQRDSAAMKRILRAVSGAPGTAKAAR